jgi:hypothetical protein
VTGIIGGGQILVQQDTEFQFPADPGKMRTAVSNVVTGRRPLKAMLPLADFSGV